MGSSAPITYFPKDATVSDQERFVYGPHLYHRDQDIDLPKQLLVDSQSRADPLWVLHYYCDRMTCENTSSLLIRLPAIRAIHIFARDFFRQAKDLSEIVFEPTTDQTIAEQQICIYFGDAVPNLLVRQNQSSRGIALMHDVVDCPSRQPGSGFEAASTTHDHISSLDTTQNATDPALTKLFDGGVVDHDAVVRFMKSTGEAKSLPYPVNTAVGRRIRIFKDQPMKVELIQSVPAQELEPPLPADLETFGSSLQGIDNLSKLLQRQFLMASQEIMRSNSDTLSIIARLQFIIRCTRLSSARANLAADAQKLFDRVDLPQRLADPQASLSKSQDRYYAPLLNASDLIKRAQEATKRVTEIDAQIVVNDNERARSGYLSATFGTILNQMGKSMDGFIDVDENKAKAVAALSDCERRRRDMESYLQTSTDAMKSFNKGVEKYKREKQRAFEASMIMAGLELGVSIGLAIATCGAGGPLTLGSLGKAQKAITEGVKLWDQIKEAIKKIIEVSAKILPKMNAAWQTQAKFNTDILYLDNKEYKTGAGPRDAAGKALLDVGRQIAASSMPPDLMTPVDYLGILADWDEFDVRVDAMFVELERILGQDQIDGMSAYKIALKGQAIRGRTLIVAMRNVQEATQFYHRQNAEKAAREARKAELQALAAKAQDKLAIDYVGQALRWNLIQESINGRRNLFIRCHQALLGVLYFTNRHKEIAKLLQTYPIRSDSSPKEYFDLLTALQDMLDDTKQRKQDIKVEITTSKYPTSFPTDWQDRLVRDKRITFTIPARSVRLMNSFHRVRVKNVNAVFLGLRPGKQTVTWEWEIGPSFADQDNDANVVLYYMPTQRLKQILTDGTTDGGWTRNESDIPSPTLFSSGRITFYDESSTGPGDVGAPDVDLTQVTEIVLKFECEGCLL